MDRLTEKDFDGNGYHLKKTGRDARYDAFDRLAAYENTGITPEQIDELLNKAFGTTHMDLRRAIALAAADKDGRVAVLPYRLNDVVYLLHRYKEMPSVISAIKYGDLIVRIRMLPFGDGAEVFATREEAEAALETQHSHKKEDGAK